MSEPVIRKLDDAEHVSRTAAEHFVSLASAAIAARGRFTAALSGGSTPRRLFQILADPPFRDQVDWSRVEFFWGDERSVPPDHQDSNYRMAREAMLESLAIEPERIHRIAAERADRDQVAEEYQEEIARVCCVAPDGDPPSLDLVLLGMGPDGHTASLFPGTTALRETVKWVVPNYVQKFETYRITMTVPLLNCAAEVRFLVAGGDKADRLVEVLEGPRETDRLPSQLIRPTGGRLEWLVDRAAAAKLTRGG